MISDWILLLIFGGLLGMVGQGARAVVGMKKIHDDAAAKGISFSDYFKAGQLAFSLVIGFIAGTLGIITLADTATVTCAATAQCTQIKALIPTLIAIGYAGTDFIEGFMQRALPSATPKATTPPAPTQNDNATPPPVG